MKTKHLSLAAIGALGVIMAVATMVPLIAQSPPPMTVRDDGLEFPDGTVQTTAAASSEEVEPRTPISSLPFVIDSSGSYFLTGDLALTTDEDGITVAADHVTVDLRGFSMVGPGSGTNSGISLDSNISGTVVINGTIRNWGSTGVNGSFAENSRYFGLHLSGNGTNGLSAGDRALIRDCHAIANDVNGIVPGGDSVVESSISQGHSSGAGFLLSGGVVIRDSIARGNSVGFSSSAPGVTIQRCGAHDNGGEGIEVASDSLVLDNESTGNGTAETGAGIRVSGSGSRIEGNNVVGNDIGIELAGVGTLMIGNSASDNGTDYSLGSNNATGAILDLTSGGTITSSNSWANIRY